MGSVPTVPAVPVTTSQDSGGDIGQILQQMNQPLPMPPQYVGGTVPTEPRDTSRPQYQPRPTNNMPVTHQSSEIKLARQKNNFASIANTIGQAGNEIQRRKQTALKEDLKTVMNAKQQISNAQIVLQNDPNNTIAKGVLEQNKQLLNSILSDPKKQKMLSKALDISFTDMDKNKTPEIAAYQQAAKEVKTQGQFGNNNPQEAAVAELAAKGANEQSKPQAQPAAQPVQPQQPVAQPQASTTPYADQLLKKDVATIQENPQYQVELKQRQALEQKYQQYVLPALLRTAAQTQIQELKDKNAATREQYKAYIDFTKQAVRLQAQSDLQNVKDKAAMGRVVQAGQQALQRTIINANSRLQVAEDNRLSKMQQQQIKDQTMAGIDADLSKVVSQRDSLMKQLATPNLTDEQKKPLEEALKFTDLHMQTLQTFRHDKEVQAYGRLAGVKDAGANSTGSVSNPEIIGDDDSDEDDESNY